MMSAWARAGRIARVGRRPAGRLLRLPFHLGTMSTMNHLKTSSSPALRSARSARLALMALLLAGAAVGAMAQAYKVVGPDGQVTYTDKPPTPQDIRVNNGSGSSSSSGAFPYQTRQAMGKYPVTIYNTKDCPSCDRARQALRQRGVPFNEYSVLLDADIAAAQARFGNNVLFPVITIGNQTMNGYSSNDLQAYLDAAGYPAQARLAGYSWPPAVPLAPRSATPVAPVAAAPDAAPSAPAPLLPPPSKNGIQF
jgi:glutaredoxin